jgi:hypothetical protein
LIPPVPSAFGGAALCFASRPIYDQVTHCEGSV